MAATKKMQPEPRIEVHLPVLLSGLPKAMLIPALSELSGGDVQSILYHQLHYLSRDDWQLQQERDAEYEDAFVEETEESRAAYMKQVNDMLLAQAQEVYAIAGVSGDDMNPDDWEILEEDHLDEADDSDTDDADQEVPCGEEAPSYNHPLDFYEEGERTGHYPCKSKRISFTRLHRQLAFVSKRQMITAVSDLEDRDFIVVKRTGRVNTYSPNYQIADLVGRIITRKNLPQAYGSGLIVLPSLAEKIGLKAAIVLQQIHLRLYEHGPDHYVIRSLADWHSRTFPFWGAETVKRVFRTLKSLGLIYSKPFQRDDGGYVNSYRINYAHIAELMALPPPMFAYGQPHSMDNNAGYKPWGNEKWKNPASPMSDDDEFPDELLASP